jgi:hypothetical protein
MKPQKRDSMGSKPDLTGSGVAAAATLAISLLARAVDPNLKFWVIVPPAALLGAVIAIGIRRRRR